MSRLGILAPRQRSLPCQNALGHRLSLDFRIVVDHTSVQRWVAGYEAAWRASETDGLSLLFGAKATYLHSPYASPVVGLRRICAMWEADRDGPDEVFTLDTEILAVENNTAVVRALVRYGDPVRQEYTDLWVLQFDDQGGLCSRFEEWPFWPGQPWSSKG